MSRESLVERLRRSTSRIQGWNSLLSCVLEQFEEIEQKDAEDEFKGLWLVHRLSDYTTSLNMILEGLTDESNDLVSVLNEMEHTEAQGRQEAAHGTQEM